MQPLKKDWKPGRDPSRVAFSKYTPENCPHCEYDRRFPETEGGGWIYQGNNGPIVSCPVCNDDGKHPHSDR